MNNPGAFWPAVQTGDIAVVKQMIAANESLLDARAVSGHTPLRMACDCGQSQLAEVLVGLGATMDVFDACAYGDAARVSSMVADEPELLCAFSHDGWTVLHLAGFFSHQELVSMLLGGGADPTAVSTNPSKNMPLHAALAGGADSGVVLLLLGQGVDVNAVAGAGATPLHLAASRGNEELVALLLARGAKPRPMDNGQLPADIARERGFDDLADRIENL